MDLRDIRRCVDYTKALTAATYETVTRSQLSVQEAAQLAAVGWEALVNSRYRLLASTSHDALGEPGDGGGVNSRPV
jgi:hypothetical protein